MQSMAHQLQCISQRMEIKPLRNFHAVLLCQCPMMYLAYPILHIGMGDKVGSTQQGHSCTRPPNVESAT